MKKLNIDIETYSSVNISFAGVYRYAESSDFNILLFAYSVDGAEVQIVDLAQGEVIPVDVLEALSDNSVEKHAYNANFERVCLSNYLGVKYLDPTNWHCTAVLAGYNGLPGNLGAVATVLKLDEDKQKLKVGKALISYFCIPCKPTKVNGGRLINLPKHDLEKWELFKDYCVRDVEAEMEIYDKLAHLLPPKKEQDLYVLDQLINDRGVYIDAVLATNIIEYNDTYTSSLVTEAEALTGLANPNSPLQLKKWFLDFEGLELSSLTKPVIKELLKTDLSATARRVLEIRQQLGKTSIKKYETMQRAMCLDGRVHGTTQFYGANRTGRWAGRLIQVQNLPRNADDIDVARQEVLAGDFDMLAILYDDLSAVFSQLIRTAIVPAENKLFAIADFSAIEARVIAWLAGESWRNEVFATHGKIYEASASQMFNIPLDEINSDLRQKGKVAELALGYGGGPGALKVMGAVEMGVKEEELQGLVDAWRASNKKITALWRDINLSALTSVKERSTVNTKYGITFICKSGMLFAILPSGRYLAYAKPHLTTNRFGGESVGYWGMDQVKKIWCQQETYGGKLVENIVQAIARDCLAEAMLRLQQKTIVMHVHDEIVIEVQKETADLELAEMIEVMAQPISWAKGLLLKGDGFVTAFYKK